jgi:hypothetical protein
LEDLSQRIFGDAGKTDVIGGSILSTALIFVLLHEYGHIAAGHFGLKQAGSVSSDKIDFEFAELQDCFTLEGQLPGHLQFRQMVELEADIVAFNLLLDLSYAIFVANDDVATLIQGHEFEEWRDSLYPPVAELVFYASAVALALIAAHQDPVEQNRDYPVPLTRMMNLAMLLLRRTLGVQGRRA